MINLAQRSGGVEGGEGTAESLVDFCRMGDRMEERPSRGVMYQA